MDFESLREWIGGNKAVAAIAGVAVLIVLAIAAYLIFFSGPNHSSLTVSVVSSEGNALWKSKVQLIGAGDIAAKATDRSGKAVFENLPTGKEITVKASGTGFKEASETIKLDKESAELKITLDPDAEAKQVVKSLTFVGPDGIKLEGKVLTVELSCSTGMKIASPTKQVSAGKLDVQVPAGCGSMVARVVGGGFEARSYSLEESSIIKLEPRVVEYGTLKISIMDWAGNSIDGAEVFVNDSYGSLVDKKLADFGRAEFSLEPGEYRVVAVPNRLGLASFSGQAAVNPNETTPIEAVLGELSLGSVKLKVTDKKSKAPLQAKATVELPDSSRFSKEGKGEMELQITRQGKSKIMVSAEGYAPSSLIEVDSANIPKEPIAIELSACTPALCNSLAAIVMDEEGLPVANARVMIVEPATDFVLDQYPVKFTDSKGVAKFTGIKNGRYKALAQKYPASGNSEEFEIKEGAPAEASVQLKIGYGSIEIEALDADGKGIPFAAAELIGDDGKRIGKASLDSAGRGSIKLRAGQKVSAIITAEGYAEHSSKSATILPDKSVKLSARLDRESLSGGISIRLLEISTDEGKKAEMLEAGKAYEAKFVIAVQKDFEYEQLGAFALVGEENEVEKEAIYISGIDVPRASYLMGRTFNPPKGSADDTDNLTNGEAKWAQIIWEEGNDAGKSINFGVKFRVRDSAVPGKRLPLEYRAFAVQSSGAVQRDPDDSQLGTAESSSAKDGLYAKAYVSENYEGSKNECDGSFCYREKMLDIKDDIYLEKPYLLKVFGEYDLGFTLTNDSEAVHDDAKLVISGQAGEEKVKILGYSIINADSQKFSSSGETFKIEGVTLGNFRKNKSVTGTIRLRPVEVAESGMLLQVYSGKKLVMEQKVELKSASAKDMNVAIVPETMPAFADFDLKVEAKLYSEEDGFQGIEGANVRVERTTTDRKKTVTLATTDGEGKATIKIPASEPDTRIRVVVEKAGYAGRSYSLKVTKNVVKFSPERLVYSLDLTSSNEEKKKLSVTNLVPLGLVLSKTGFGGKFLGLLDEQKMANYAAEHEGSEIAFNDTAEFNFLAAISEDAKYIKEKRSVSGKLYLEFRNEEKKITWPIEVPMGISIALAEAPATQNCIEVSIKEWKDATISGRAETEFYIRNNCRGKNNKPLDLKNLKAKVEWKSGKFGFVEIQAIDSKTGQAGKQVLADGIFSTLFDRVPGEGQYIGEIIFTPKGNSSGKKAEFKITIDASQFTEYGEQSVGSSGPIEAEIDILNLRDCIKFTPDPEAGVVIPENAQDGSLTIDSSACGNIDIDFWMCKDDKGCAGGAEGEILVQPDKFTLKPTNSSKTVRISRQAIPGMYGAKVFIRTNNTLYRELATVDVLARPTPEDAFELRKYSFTTLGQGAKDSTEITNRFLSETIPVDASICDWGEATEKGWWDWTGAGVGAVYGALMGIKPAMSASNAAAKGVAQGIGKSMDATKAAQKASAAADKTSENTLETVCSKISSAVSSTTSAQGPCSITPAAAQVNGAATAVQSANSICQSAKATSSELNNIDSKLQDASMNGGEWIGSTFQPLDASSLMQAKNAVNQEMLAKLQQIAAQLNAGATSLSSAAPVAAATCKANPEACQCETSIAQAVSSVGEASSSTQAYVANQYGETVAKTGLLGAQFASTNALAQAGNQALGGAATAASTASTGFFTPTTIMSMYTLGGFFIGGLMGNIFGTDPCSQRHTSGLPDYVINLLTDAEEISSDSNGFVAQYDKGSAKIIGPYNKQRLGVVFTNNGEASQKPSYATFSFNAVQHLHAIPTKIDKGNKDFGPFNVPDREKVNLEAKIHLKFKTTEAEETMPDLSFDTLSCESGVKFGRTGKGALPKVKLDWTFANIGKDACLEQNPEGVYCDATQFSIMLTKRLKALEEFFNKNQSLKCPANPFNTQFGVLVKDLNVNPSAITQQCYLNDWTGFIEGEPAIKYLIEANEGTISWTQEIPNKEAFMAGIHFNSLLMKDSFSDDFRRDFAEHYADARFFDTAEWFYKEATDSQGRPYGIANLFSQGNISFKNRFFSTYDLPSAGTYDTLVNISGKDGTFRFFSSDGTPNIQIGIDFYLLQEPNPSSAFYYMPLDGLVGLENDSFNRQGYGTSFVNEDSATHIVFENTQQPMKTYNDSGSNAATMADSKLEKSLYALNSSPATRGNVLSVEKVSPSEAKLVFSPSKATPVMMKVSAPSISEQPLSAFYTVANNDVPADTGETMTFWEGGGACLDFSGTVITESFDSRSDRAATTRDPVKDWETAYGVDFGPVVYTGDSYIRTIFYTNPLEIYSLNVEQPAGRMSLVTPEESGEKVMLRGISGASHNSPAGGTTGTITTVADVFRLVEDGDVCVSDSGRKADFFWNPKAVYAVSGATSNISEISNSLKAGSTCIGLG